MAILEFQTQIGAPPEAVFSYVSDLEKHVDWSGGQAIRKTSEGPIAVGSTYDPGTGPVRHDVQRKIGGDRV